tara:strand:+ start:4394 stop:5287 length:894 start_codon:yes stop_codon:yes gene_type:complete
VYSKHASQFDRLIVAGMSPEQVRVFRDIFCNPQIELHHEGSVNLTGYVTTAQSQSGRWAVAQSNWEYNPDSTTYPSNGGLMATVMCKEANDYLGNGTSGRSNMIVYLPVGTGEDPNIASGDVVLFFETLDGLKVAPGYGDFRIGAIRIDANADKGTSGWAVMNGTENSVANGGSGVDLRGKFLRQWNTTTESGNTGGGETGALDLEVVVTDTGNAHHHGYSTSSVPPSDGSGTSVTVVSGSTTEPASPALQYEAVVQKVDGGGAASAVSVPPYRYVAMLERLNNSKYGSILSELEGV